MDSWYFAYGSNLLQEQMLSRIGTIGPKEDPPRIARLENHRLVFQLLKKGGPAYANIQTPGDGVLGVIYRCKEVDLVKMDYFEQGYERQSMTVTDRQGEVLSAIVYVIQPAGAASTGTPGDDYLAKIVTGARQHGLPEFYISQIVAESRTDDSRPRL